MKTTVVALLVGLSSVSGAQATGTKAARATESAGASTVLTIEQLRTFAPHVRQLRVEPKSLTLHVGQSADLNMFKVIVVDDAGRQLGFTRDFDFAVKPGEPASVVPKRITGDRVGKTELTLRFPRAAWTGAPASRPSVVIPVVVKQ